MHRPNQSAPQAPSPPSFYHENNTGRNAKRSFGHLDDPVVSVFRIRAEANERDGVVDAFGRLRAHLLCDEARVVLLAALLPQAEHGGVDACAWLDTLTRMNWANKCMRWRVLSGGKSYRTRVDGAVLEDPGGKLVFVIVRRGSHVGLRSK